MTRIFALIPAAGKSARMGRPKLSLPLGNRSVLEHVLAALKRGQVHSTLVVVGPHGNDLANLAEREGANALRLQTETLDMQETVRHGLDWLEAIFHPAPDDAWLLVPADHPALDAGVIDVLARVRKEKPAQAIFIPTHDGRRGHPALIGWDQVPFLRAWPANQGLNRFFRSRAGQTCECPVSDPDILLDLDTPEDYRRLLARDHLNEA